MIVHFNNLKILEINKKYFLFNDFFFLIYYKKLSIKSLASLLFALVPAHGGRGQASKEQKPGIHVSHSNTRLNAVSYILEMVY